MQDIELVAKVVASVLAALLAWDKLLKPHKNHAQDEIKTELEVRSFFSEDSEEYRRLSQSIKRRVRREYLTEEELASKSHYQEKALAVVVGIAFGLWTLQLMITSGSPWAWLTGFLSFGSFASLLENDKEPTPDTDDSENRTD